MAIRRKNADPGLAKARARAKPVARGSDPGRRKTLTDIGDAFARWERPEKVFSPVRAVPTIFPAIDVALGCGGLPLERFFLVHGPSSGGKTQLGIGLGLSFLNAGHLFALQEPETTTPLEFVAGLMAEQASNPRFVAGRPGSYEEAVDDVREFCNGVSTLREKRKIPKEAGGLVVCDSITKLVPKSLLDKLLDEGAEKSGVDGMSGGAGRYIAAINAQWCRELTGLLYRTGCSFVAVARERTSMERFGSKWMVPGGKDLVFEASVQFRVTRKPLKVGSKIVGSRHDVWILKTKVADGTRERVDAFFHTANGDDGAPVGFDRARDVWELSLVVGAVKRFKRKGSVGYETFDGEVFPDDVEANVARLRGEESLRNALEEKCRASGELKGTVDGSGIETPE
jgi:RecA/RadA recombinase